MSRLSPSQRLDPCAREAGISFGNRPPQGGARVEVAASGWPRGGPAAPANCFNDLFVVLLDSVFVGAPDGLLGGGTDWLVVRDNVVPGEVFDLRLAIWDTSDYFFDSLALLDGFQWSVDLATPGTTQN